MPHIIRIQPRDVSFTDGPLHGLIDNLEYKSSAMLDIQRILLSVKVATKKFYVVHIQNAEQVSLGLLKKVLIRR